MWSRYLCPALKPGQVVVMDNLSAHKVSHVRDRIEQVGATLFYTRPTSIPSKKLGRRSNNCCARQRLVPQRLSTKP
jgi:hypothetical protein